MASFRARKAAALRAAGLTYQAIGDALGVSATRARVLVRAAASPLDRTVSITAVRRTTAVDRLPLSRPARKALKASGLKTFADVLEAERTSLLSALVSFRRVGPKQALKLDNLLETWKAGEIQINPNAGAAHVAIELEPEPVRRVS